MDFKRNIKWTLAAAATLLSAQSFAGNVEWSGFGSAYYSQALNKELIPSGYENTFADFGSFSNFGLNLSSEINPELSVAGQFVAQSDTSTQAWTMVTKWGFLSYRPSENWNMKFGRQLYPAFIASEFSSVGFLLPYVRIPLAVQNGAPFSGFDGASVAYNWGGLRFSLFGGSPNVQLVGTPTSSISGGISNLAGATVEWANDGLLVRATAAHTEANLGIAVPTTVVPSGTLPVISKANTYTGGIRYDKDSFVFWGEGIYSGNTDKDATMLHGSQGYYALLGYRMGQWLPRYTYSSSTSDNGSIAQPANAQGQQEAHTFGLNYQSSAQSVIKLEFESTKVAADRVATMVNTRASRGGGAAETSGNSVLLGVDFIF